LQLETEVCWAGPERIARAAAIAGGTSEAEDVGADLTLDKHILQEVFIKKGLQPGARRELGNGVRQADGVSEKRACELIGITRWTNRYRSRRDKQVELRMGLRELAGARVRYGYRRWAVRSRREGGAVHARRVYRLYREAGWQVQTAQRTKRAAHVRVPLAGEPRPNQRWRMDFVRDRLADGRWFRILTVVDQYTRECLCAYADRWQTGQRVVAQIQRLVTMRGAPESITTDQGREFAGRAREVWAYMAEGSWISSGQAGLYRTDTARVATAACATNV
jgi:putative transposase